MLSNSATVQFIEGVVSQETIIDEIDDIGFTAQFQSVKQISGPDMKENDIVIVMNKENTSKIKKATIEIDGMLMICCILLISKHTKEGLKFYRCLFLVDLFCGFLCGFCGCFANRYDLCNLLRSY